MGNAIPAQRPAVVLRSHYQLLRALLAVAMIAVAGLAVAVVILANDRDQLSNTSATKPIESTHYGDSNPATRRPEPPGIRYDGGLEEGTRGLGLGGALGARYAGGREEGTGGPHTASRSPSIRYDGGPEEGSTGYGH